MKFLYFSFSLGRNLHSTVEKSFFLDATIFFEKMPILPTFFWQKGGLKMLVKPALDCMANSGKILSPPRLLVVHRF